MQAIVRAHAWLNDLMSGRYNSIETLAKDIKLHPKIIRQQLRLAFLAPSITKAVLTGEDANFGGDPENVAALVVQAAGSDRRIDYDDRLDVLCRASSAR